MSLFAPLLTPLGIATLGAIATATTAALHYPELRDLVFKPVRKVPRRMGPIVDIGPTQDMAAGPQVPFDWARDDEELAPRGKHPFEAPIDRELRWSRTQRAVRETGRGLV